MRSTVDSQRVRPRTAWTAWALMIATTVPVCEAQDFWMLAMLAGVLSALGVGLSCWAGRSLLSQRMAAAIALALGVLTAAASAGEGTVKVFPVADWLIAVAVLKCWQLGTSRDYSHILTIAGVLLLVGSLVSWQLGFAIALTLATILGPWLLIHWHLMAEQERWGRLAERYLPYVGSVSAGTGLKDRRSILGGVGLATSAFCSVVAFLIFAAFPRVRTPLRPVVGPAARPVTGLAAEAHLNDMGRLQTSDRVVMRVRLRVAGQTIGGEDLQPYFRGMTYDTYNGRGWENQPPPPRTIHLSPDGGFSPLPGGGKINMPGATEQDYWVEAGPLPCLPALTTPAAIGCQEVRQVLWREDGVLLPAIGMPAAMNYKIISVPWQGPAGAPMSQATDSQPATLGSDGEPASQVTKAGQVGAPVVRPAVREMALALAGEVTSRPADPPPADREQVVNRFMRYFTDSSFKYSLEPPPHVRRRSPLEEFLAVKRGHCEYYATALAVFCRCVNIPARYVTGYHGGKYNEVGDFYAVRDSDAHSWVEVWLPERGWVTLDPTPPGKSPTPTWSVRSRLGSLLDYLQFEWSNWVVAYDVLHRKSLLGTFGEWMKSSQPRSEQSWTQFLWMFQQLLAGPETLSPLGKLLYWLGLAGILALSGYLVIRLGQQLLHRWRLHRQTLAARRAGVRFYERVISVLARRHLVRQAAETPREFALRAEAALPEMRGCVLDLIENYYAMRYGQQQRAEAGEHVARQILSRMKAGGTGGPDSSVSPG